VTDPDAGRPDGSPELAAGRPGGSPEPAAQPAGLARRRFLTRMGAAGGAAAAVGYAGGFATRALASPSPGGSGHPGSTVEFYGRRQAGIITPAQDRLAFGSLSLADGVTAAEVRDLLREWTLAAARMTRGQLVGDSAVLTAPPLDTGEALGSPPANLTVTIGYGPSFFDGRLGLQSRKPAALADLPPLPNENLDPAYTGGDLCIQACSDDPLVAFHAVRNLARLGMGVVQHDWMELGFGRTSATSTGEATPRNLLGFKDGTRNIKSQQADVLHAQVWVGAETDQSWLRGGSYLVARRIRMFIENWDRDYLEDQQNVIGRSKAAGAPLSGGSEFTEPDLAAHDDQGGLKIPARAHIRLASREANHGIQILRRGYSYTDGIDPERGTLLGGLFFLAYMKNPSQFIALQRNLGAHDALNEYIQHTGSAVFACPPGLSQGQHWGDTLFAA
jgi:deferrochelatase/peroxidase EfeB